MENTRDSSHDADKAQEILEKRGPDGQIIYDHVSKDPATGQWIGRRHDDHTKTDRLT